MSSGCVRWVLVHTLRAVSCSSPACRTPALRFLKYRESTHIPGSLRWSPFCTAVDDTEQAPAPKKKKQDPRAHATISSIGRKIPHRLIQVISETGDDLGTMHRAHAIKIMDEQGLKLVLLSEDKDPPVYRLMSGKKIHEEQLKLREKQKAKAAPVQVKELTFSSGIASHDLTTKLNQVQNWLQKKHHVRITLRAGRGEAAVNLDTTLEQTVQQMEVMVGFVSRPKVVRDGRAAMCVLRPPSAKELSEKEKSETTEPRSENSEPHHSRDDADTIL